ncbi:aap-1 [Pristionchus pacificus]|uniref:Aap-1 n=1 Tax=Pristionchus pacificus TaxID=54126 RepID=A0A2A6BTE0_PRIPA|nr:aap-1 [Pristionchus pacificus]|eukprot:PDM69199.1 aap-1 [Pristionchus pacificus]
MTSSSRTSSDDGGAQLLELPELVSEQWYWPGACKNEISKALEGKPDGTFVVRDASSPGDYTLTVRACGQTKLVKIHVVGGLCGFNLQSMDFRSIQQLIDCHRRTSLKTYNANLDTMLLYALRDSKRRQSGDEEFDRFLAIERFRTMKCAFMRATKLYDLHHGEQIRAENLLKVEKAALADVHKKLKLLEEVVSTQKGVIEDLPQENVKLHLAYKGNAEVLSSALSTLRLEATAIELQKARLEHFIVEHKGDLERESENVQLLSAQLEKQMAEMQGAKGANGHRQQATISETRMGEISEQVEFMRQQFEPLAVASILNELPMRWDPARFLVNDPSKEAAGALIEAARARLLADWTAKEEKSRRRRESHSHSHSSTSSTTTIAPSFDGIFLIRPSASQEGRLVLSVLCGGRLSHCLVEEAHHGWGFENGGLSFVSIGDFVRYYSANSLEEHNKQIRTVLTEPVHPP